MRLGFISNPLLRTPLMCWMMSQHVHLCIILIRFFLNNVEVLLLSSFKLIAYVKMKEGMTI